MKRRLQMLFVLLGWTTILYAQDLVITGKVIDEKGDGLPGATVRIKDTAIGSVTNLNGEYSIKVSSSEDVLTFSFVGYKDKEMQVGSNTIIDIAMNPDISNLEEVVVTAMSFERSKESLTYAQQGVNAKEMAEAPENNFMMMLSGKVAGVQITPAPNPTGSSRIVIRGNSSLTGDNQPLIVVDGIPIDNQGTDLHSWSAGIDYGNNGGDINPNDIADIQILKGPNAAALYGSRAANGVVVITTKKGSAQNGLKVTFNSNFSTQVITEFMELQNNYGVGNVYKFISGTNELPEELDTNSRSWGPRLSGFDYINYQGDTAQYYPQPGNIGDFYKPAFFLTNSLSIQGGSPNAKILASYTNYRGNTVVENMNKNTKHTFNIRGILTPATGLTLDTRIMYSVNTVSRRQQNNGSERNPNQIFIFMPRNLELSTLKPWKTPDGDELSPRSGFKNPYWSMFEDPNEDRRDRVQGFAKVEYELTDWLTTSVKVGGDLLFHNGFEARDIGRVSGDVDGYYRNFSNFSSNLTLEGLVRYAKNYGKFGVVGMVGLNKWERKSFNRRSTIQSMIERNVYSITNTDGDQQAEEWNSHKVINSVLGLTSVNYDEKIYLDITARNDWSSTLPAHNRSFFYPSFGLTVVPTKLLDLPEVFNSIKLRGNWAQVGNDTGPYRLVNTYGYVPGLYDGNTTIRAQTTRNNPDLKPEITTSIEVGGEVSMFNNRASFDFTYYNSSSINQIVSPQVSGASGFRRMLINAGEVQNYGIELTSNIDPIVRENFNWTISTNFSANRNIVKSITEGTNRIVLDDWNGNQVTINAEVGLPYGVLKGQRWAKNDAGQYLVDGPESSTWGEPILEYDSILGNSTPDWTASISNSFRYKNWNFRFLVDSKMGNEMISITYHKGVVAGTLKESEIGRDDYWIHRAVHGEDVPSGEIRGGMLLDAVYAVTNESGEVIGYEQNEKHINPDVWHKKWRDNMHDRSTYDASYIKLREIAVNYSFPNTLMEKLPFDDASVGLFARNLWLIYSKTPSGLDPEASVSAGNGQGLEFGSLPYNSTFGGSINIRF